MIKKKLASYALFIWSNILDKIFKCVLIDNNDYYEKITYAVLLAALVHLKFVTIHPFGDGNGRISRLFMNYVLNKNKYPMIVIDYSDRNSYYNALEQSQMKKDETIFAQWFFKRYVK